MKRSPSYACSPKKRLFVGRIFLNLFILSIVIFWAVLYLPNLRTTPNWYGDETLTLQIGLSLIEGKLQNRATYCTFFSPAYNYQPGYALLSGFAARLTGGDIVGARFFAAVIGLAIALTGFFVLRKKYGYSCALTFAFLFLGYSQAVIHYRWIYPHSVVGLSLILALAFILRRPSYANDWKAGAVLVLGACSNLLAIHAVVASLLCRLFSPRSWLPIILPTAATFLITIMFIYARYGNWVFEDLFALQEMYSRYSMENAAGLKAINNLLAFFLQDWTHIAVLLSIPLCLNKSSYKFVLVGITVVFLLVKNRQNLPLFYYQALAIYPILIAILAVGCHIFLKSVRKMLCKVKWKPFLAKFLLRWSPAVWALVIGLANLPALAKDRLPIKIMPWVVQSCQDYETAAIWLNKETCGKDLVIVHWNLAWLLKAKTADVLMAAAWAGYPAGDYFPSPPAKDRFVYPADIEQAKYFVVTELDENWTFHQGQTRLFLASTTLNSWPLIFQATKVKIFKNPAFN